MASRFVIEDFGHIFDQEKYDIHTSMPMSATYKYVQREFVKVICQTDHIARHLSLADVISLFRSV